MTDRETNTLAACGMEELFSHLCCCVSFLVVAGNSFWCYYLPTSCAVVSVFLLWWKIAFGCTVSKKDSYWVSLL